MPRPWWQPTPRGPLPSFWLRWVDVWTLAPAESNVLLRKAGLDDNGRFRKVGEALNYAFRALEKVGIEPDEILSAHKFSGESGSRTIELAFSNLPGLLT